MSEDTHEIISSGKLIYESFTVAFWNLQNTVLWNVIVEVCSDCAHKIIVILANWHQVELLYITSPRFTTYAIHVKLSGDVLWAETVAVWELSVAMFTAFAGCSVGSHRRHNCNITKTVRTAHLAGKVYMYL